MRICLDSIEDHITSSHYAFDRDKLSYVCGANLSGRKIIRAIYSLDAYFVVFFVLA